MGTSHLPGNGMCANRGFAFLSSWLPGSVWGRSRLLRWESFTLTDHGDRLFINKVLNFLALGWSLYGLAALYQYVSHDPIIKHTVKCKYCRKLISEKASHIGCFHGDPGTNFSC